MTERGLILPVSNVAETDDGRTLLVTMPFARELYEQLLADWEPATAIRLQRVGDEIMFVVRYVPPPLPPAGEEIDPHSSPFPMPPIESPVLTAPPLRDRRRAFICCGCGQRTAPGHAVPLVGLMVRRRRPKLTFADHGGTEWQWVEVQASTRYPARACRRCASGGLARWCKES